jgi:hypothetical protein
MDEFIAIIAQKTGTLTPIYRTIRSIDKENNGFITSQEMEDIFASYFPELSPRRLIPLFEKFRDPIVRVLISYKKAMLEFAKDFLAKRIELQA